jgi:hypothetical protein
MAAFHARIQLLGINPWVALPVRVTVELNPTAPREPVPPELKQALAAQPELKAAFTALAPSRRKEICRNLTKLKSAAARERNLQHVLRYLAGERSPSAPAFLRVRAAT